MGEKGLRRELLLCALACACASAAAAAYFLHRRRPKSAAAAATTATTVLLVDNGSLHAASYLSLRAMAAAVSARTGVPVLPASARFADRIPAAELQGVAGDTLATALARALGSGSSAAPHHFLILPAFFGPADTLRTLVPEQVARAAAGAARVVTHSQARPLAAEGDARLARALAAGVASTLAAQALAPEAAAVVLCDHGSPHAEVARVRGLVAGQLQEALAAAGLLRRLRAPLAQASMERREGSQYDFNEPQLAALLRTPPYSAGDVVLAPLFLSPGAHAGPGGDIDQIIAEAVAEAAAQGRALRVHRAPLLAPAVTDILVDRLSEALAELQGSA